MVAQVAADEPDTAAKIVQPMMLVCSSRPGTRSSQGARPRNMSSESRVRNRISPIHIKSGSAVSVHELADPHTETAMASPAGRDEKSSMPIHATPARARPIHTPLPRSANSTTTSRVVMSASILFAAQRFSRDFFSPRATPFQDELIGQRDHEDHGSQRHGELRNP